MKLQITFNNPKSVAEKNTVQAILDYLRDRKFIRDRIWVSHQVVKMEIEVNEVTRAARTRMECIDKSPPAQYSK